MRLLAPDRAPETAFDLIGELRALSECLRRRGDVRGSDVALLAAEGLIHQRRKLRETFRAGSVFLGVATAERERAAELGLEARGSKMIVGRVDTSVAGERIRVGLSY